MVWRDRSPYIHTPAATPVPESRRLVFLPDAPMLLSRSDVAVVVPVDVAIFKTAYDDLYDCGC